MDNVQKKDAFFLDVFSYIENFLISNTFFKCLEKFWARVCCDLLIHKRLDIQRLIGLAVAGCNHARRITKASDKSLDARQDDFNKRIWSRGSLVNNPVR